MYLNVNGKNLQIVRSRSAVQPAASAVKMKTDSIRYSAQGIVSAGMKAMRQCQNCSPNDMAHKTMIGAITKAITHSAMASHDAGYYSDSSAAHSVASSSDAHKAYKEARKSVSAMSCAKCNDAMKSMGAALDNGIAIMSENAGEADADADDSGSFKGLYIPDNSIFRGTAIKRLSKNKVSGRLVCFTGPDKRDAEGEYFTKETDFMIGVFPIKGQMALYSHGLDRSIGSCPIGTLSSVEVKDDGIHVEAEFDFLKNYKTYVTALEAPTKWKDKQIAMAEQYDKIIGQMIDEGTLGWSSGAHAASVQKNADGQILRWPIIEGSMTPIPAMPFDTKISPAKSLLANDAFARRLATV
jgi:hypothetical protein